MTEERRVGERVTVQVLPILAAAALMLIVVLVLGRSIAGREDGASYPPATPMASPGEPIAAEAGVFQTRATQRAVPPLADRRNQAHRRTLTMYRTLRAFPGAPPRIPHGLTYDQMRTSGCNSCHLRGGYVERFGAYVPVTPHPEYSNCLQCHVPEDVTVRTAAPTGANSACLQCHVPGGRTAPFVPLDWQPAEWPHTRQIAMDGAPPAVPHDLQMRGNCLACHMAPSGVEEIRTTHAERANCRQCHATVSAEEDVFTRPLDRGAGAGGRP
jgi:cytochrome c-type protein NapB